MVPRDRPGPIPTTHDPSSADACPDAGVELPERIGRYRVSRVLGEGAMGAVFAGHDEALGRDVAIKTIRVPRGDAEVSWQVYRDRFMQETRALGALSHPNIVQVFDVVVQDEVPYLVMERIDGPSLETRIEDGTLTDHEVRSIGTQLAQALEAAHACGILHRDIKPANVLEASPGRWKLVDFGIARVPGSSLTAAGQFLGTPSYAGPESLLEGRFSPASDVYSLGATLYAALVGSTPYGDRTVLSLVNAMAERHELRSPRALRPGVTRRLDATIMAALALDPDLRPAPRRIADALAERPRLDPRGRSAGAALVVAAALMIAGALASQVSAGSVPEQAPKTAFDARASTTALRAGATAIAARPTHVDIWSSAPAELAEIDRRLRAGWRPGRATDRSLIRYAFAHRSDPRPSLLLARIYLTRGWRADALAQYERAHAVDASVRTDPTMLSDLVGLAAGRSHGPRAAALVERIYGEDALQAIDAALADTALRARRARLAQLRARVAGTGPTTRPARS